MALVIRRTQIGNSNQQPQSVFTVSIHVLSAAKHDRNIQYAVFFSWQLDCVYSFASWYISPLAG